MVLGKKFIALSLMVFLFLSGTTILTRHYFRQLVDNNEWVLHTQKVLLTIEETRVLLLQSITKRRGYIITDDPKRLEGWASIQDQIDRHLRTLRHYMDDTLEGQIKLDRLEALVKEQNRILDRSIQLHRENLSDDPQQVALTTATDPVTRDINGLLASLGSMENAISTRRSLESAEAVRQTGMAFDLTLVLAFLSLGFALYLQDRQVRGRMALVRQNRLMDSILSNMAEGVSVADREGKILFFNPAMERITGYPPSHRSPDHWPEEYGAFHEDGTRLTQGESGLMRAVRGEATDNLTFLIKNPRTPGTYVSVNGRPLRDEEGLVDGGVIVLRDITEQKKAERIIAQYASVTQYSDDAIIGADLRGTINAWNNGAEKLYGYRSEEALGKSIDMVLPADQKEEGGRALELIRMGVVISNRETAHVRKDGTEVQVAVTLSPIRDAKGAINGVSSIARDITERKQAEARFLLAFEASPSGMILVDGKGSILLVNAEVERIFGYRREQLLGQPIDLLVPSSSRSAHPAHREAFAADPRPRQVEGRGLRGLRKDGVEVPLEVGLKPIQTKEGTLVLAVVVDLTERMKAEETNARLATIVENSMDAIIGADLQGVITSWNGGAEKTYGYSAGEMIGKNIDLLRVPEEKEVFREQLEQIRRGGAQTERDTLRVRKDGRTIHIAQTYSPLRDKDGDVIGFSTISRDITERIKTEEKLADYTRRLESSNRDLQDFVFVASHDLQEPLRKIQAFGDLLKRELGGDLPSPAADRLRRIQDAAKRMGILIEDLLGLSRITTQAKPFGPVRLGNILEEILSDLEVRIRKSGGVVEVGPLPEIEADPTQMRQLFQNLVGNSLKFHKPDRSPVVRVSGEVDKGRDRVVIRVSDEGIGFDQKYAEKVFNVFQRLHSASEYEGTGIGLAVCRKVVERHGGTITASSKPGEGTVFEVVLPLHQTHREEAG